MPRFDIVTYSCPRCPWTHCGSVEPVAAHRLWHLYEAVMTAGDTFGPGDAVGAVAEAEIVLVLARAGS